MFEKYIVPAIGVAAFVIGGLVAREKAVEIVGIVQKSFEIDTPSPS
jgi:hypothetical protein